MNVLVMRLLRIQLCEVEKMNYEEKIRTIPDYPKQGIMFKDITPLILDGYVLRKVIREMADKFRNRRIDKVVGPESRGFIFGALVAYELGVGFVPVRKKGKLPYEVISGSYEKEYGLDHIEMHKDAIERGDNVLIVDDLIATGGTVGAMVQMVESLGGKIEGMSFLIELDFLKPRERFKGYDIHSIIHYDKE